MWVSTEFVRGPTELALNYFIPIYAVQVILLNQLSVCYNFSFILS